MTFTEVLMIVPGFPAVSIILWLTILSVVLYLARIPAHRAMITASNILHHGLRMAANSVRMAEKNVANRNKEVLLSTGREAAERMIEREFERISNAVHADLAAYPALQREVSEEITRIEEDYKESSEVPPSPPGWAKAVEAVAKIPSSGDSMVANILGEINKSLNKAQGKALAEYRQNSKCRHKLLGGMLPHWRKLLQVTARMDKNISSLLERSKAIDRHMDEHEQIMQRTDRAAQMLASSSMTQFFIASFVLAIAIGGAVINFHLIARPMQEMVGGSSYIIGFKTAHVAAMVIIFVEMAMGLFLMESLRITRLFPVISALDDKKRVRMIWVTFAMLFALASIEASLAYMRDILSQDDAALLASLVNQQGQVAETISNRWITTAAQMGMGFMLPFALTFVAIPLESFVHSLRTVLGILTMNTLRITAFLLRLSGNLFRYTGTALVQVYDLLIFAPLWIEKSARLRSGRHTDDKHALHPTAPTAEASMIGGQS